ncbi:aspartate aminotransferase [Thiosulfatihalobacter marinus]|uniref:aspartate aminotransferase n=1 Tax=Thiosulfatihalobacter marinus TaxID=2792481 RepID=UPI0018D74CBB|nr:aspartate aminotransferase [Thiosulfatihalobacter marinus]
MIYPESALFPEIWPRNVLSGKAVMHGQVIRRKTRDIERYCGMRAFLGEVRARGFHAVQNREQVIVF